MAIVNATDQNFSAETSQGLVLCRFWHNFSRDLVNAFLFLGVFRGVR